MYSKRWKRVRLLSMMLCPLTFSSRKVCGERHDAYPPVISSMVYWKIHRYVSMIFPANKTSIWKWFKHILKLHKLHLEICPDFTKPEGTTGGHQLSVLYLRASWKAIGCIYIYFTWYYMYYHAFVCCICRIHVHPLHSGIHLNWLINNHIHIYIYTGIKRLYKRTCSWGYCSPRLVSTAQPIQPMAAFFCNPHLDYDDVN